MDIISLKSYAKINFGLNIISKRPDGYHNIETVFYPIQLYDELLIKASNAFTFKSNSDILTSNKDNLIIKAKKAVEKYIKRELNVDVILRKNIPIGAGLGGGSSNAATMLQALNGIFSLNLSEHELLDIASKLGSDVPFFLDPLPKFAEGKGEILRHINFQINYPVLIVNPGIHVSTPWAYSKIRTKNPDYGIRKTIATEIINFSELKEKVTNDFEEVVFIKHPGIGKIKDTLYELGSEFALMTGSGSTVFGIFPSLEKAEEAEKYFSKKYFTFIHFEKN
jgi:4-diphosphocytidyl-2-C-methyl-D-erythritol kinase